MKRKPLIRKPCSLCGLVFRHRRDCSRARAPKPPKARKPIKARNYKRRPAQLAVAQREAVMERSGGQCEFEITVYSAFAARESETPFVWRRCPKPGADTAHILRRRLCTGSSVYDRDVALWACRNCHALYDSRLGTEYVRVSEVALTRAISAIKAAEQNRRERGLAVVNLPPKNEDAA